MKLLPLLALSLMLSAVPLAAAAPGGGGACSGDECPSGSVGPCEYGWRWAGMSDEQGFWYPSFECSA